MDSYRSPEGIIRDLLDQDWAEVEKFFRKWLDVVFEDYNIKDFDELVEDKIAWMKFAELAKFKTVAFEAKYFSNKNLENYVKMIQDIWKENKRLDLFEFFDRELRKDFSEDFKFVTDFKAIIYSDTQEVVFVIIVATVLSLLLVQQSEEDSDFKIFELI